MHSENVKESDSSSDDDSVEELSNIRQKRSLNSQSSPNHRLPGCDEQSEKHTTIWPPKQANANEWSFNFLRHKNPGNPDYGPRMQLFSSTGWFIALYDKNIVKGSRDESDRYTYFELSYAGVPGHVRIQCLANLLYLAMNEKGRLYGEQGKTEEATVFIESLAGSYNTYLSRKYAHLGWYIGLKRSGKVKKGLKTAIHQKAVKFLPRRTNLN